MALQGTERLLPRVRLSLLLCSTDPGEEAAPRRGCNVSRRSSSRANLLRPVLLMHGCAGGTACSVDQFSVGMEERISFSDLPPLRTCFGACTFELSDVDQTSDNGQQIPGNFTIRLAIDRVSSNDIRAIVGQTPLTATHRVRCKRRACARNYLLESLRWSPQFCH